MTLKKLTTKQEEAIDELDGIAIAASLEELLFWELEGFGNLTITELTDVLIDRIIAFREEGKEA